MQRAYGGRLVGGLLAAATLCCASLSGCSSSGSEAAPPDGGHETSQLEVPELDETHRDDLTHERAVDWTRYQIADETSIRLFFTAGSEQCYGTRAAVEETETTVKIAIIEGTLPDAPEHCILVARQTSILVKTTQPVADREIIALPDPELRDG